MSSSTPQREDFKKFPRLVKMNSNDALRSDAAALGDTSILRFPPRDSPSADEPPPPEEGPLIALLRLKPADEPDDDEEDNERTIKVVLVGDGTSGKTSIVSRFAQRDFTGHYSQTIGVDFFSRRIPMPQHINVLFQLWDVGGQSISASMLSKYVFDADCVMFVYDVTNAASFESIADWVSVVKRCTKNREKPVHCALVGNKTDQEHRRTVRIDRHTRLADQYGMSSHYVSAKTGDSIDLSFKLMAAEVLGMQLSKTDVELAINAVEAPVAVLEPEPEEVPKRHVPQVTPTVTTRDAEGNVEPSKAYSATKTSSIACQIQ